MTPPGQPASARLPTAARPAIGAAWLALITLVIPLCAAAQRDAGPTCRGLPASIVGTKGDDRLHGTARDDVVSGGEGVDRIDGGGGNDLICGGPGNDVLEGGPGIDVLDGGAGDDTLNGAAGRDAVTYEDAPGAVQVDLGRHVASGWGSDRVAGVEIVLGSAFGDTIVGDSGRNHLAGIRGNDRLSGGAGSDLLDGGPGTDAVDGGPESDYCIRAEKTVSCP